MSRALLRMMRPANLPTAAADPLAGAALVAAFSYHSPALLLPSALLLMVSSILIYAGGVTLNDWFDQSYDRKLRRYYAVT